MGNWLKWIFLGFGVLRVIGWLFGISFYCGYAEVWFWMLLTVLGLVLWFMHLKKKKQRILLVIFALIGIFPLYLILLFGTWLSYGSWEEEKLDRFKKLEHPVMLVYMNRADGGSGIKITIVEPRFGGFLLQEYDSFDAPFYMDDDVSYSWLDKKYVFPKAIKEDHIVVYWKERKMLFDFITMTCYKLKKRNN